LQTCAAETRNVYELGRYVYVIVLCCFVSCCDVSSAEAY
jgi:hypothetical protein